MDGAALRDIAEMARVGSSDIEKRGESNEMKSIPGVWVQKLQKISNLVTGCHFSEGYTP